MKSLYFGGPTWMFLTPEQMYGEEAKLRGAHRYYQDASIYFITKMKKVRFNPAKSTVQNNGSIQGEIVIGDPRKPETKLSFELPGIEVLYSTKLFQGRFESRQEFLQFALHNYYRPSKPISKALNWLGKMLFRRSRFINLANWLMTKAYSIEVFVIHKSEYEITFFDPIAYSLSNRPSARRSQHSCGTILDEKVWDSQMLDEVNFKELPVSSAPGLLRLTIDQVANIFDVDVGPQEVVYVGKTERLPFERLLPHEKLQELQAKLLRSDAEAIVVHLFAFQTAEIPGSLDKPARIGRELAITTIEAELINYFKPEMNDKYMKDHRRPTWEHLQELKRAGFRTVVTELDIDGQYVRFASPNASKAGKNRHCFISDLYTHQRKIH